jgi:hypothetical protein
VKDHWSENVPLLTLPVRSEAENPADVVFALR